MNCPADDVVMVTIEVPPVETNEDEWTITSWLHEVASRVWSWVAQAVKPIGEPG
jgi:hypothetical protein